MGQGKKTLCLTSQRQEGHLAMEIKEGVGPVSLCVCVRATYNRHCPSLLPIMGRPGFHIPQIIEGYLRRAEASLDPPVQILVNSTRAQKPTEIRKRL